MFGGVWAQAELRKVLSAMGGRVSRPSCGVAHAHEQLRDGERLELEPGQEQRLDEILAELVAWRARVGPSRPKSRRLELDRQFTLYGGQLTARRRIRRR